MPVEPETPNEEEPESMANGNGRALDVLTKVTFTLVYVMCAAVIGLMIQQAATNANRFTIHDWVKERRILKEEIEAGVPPKEVKLQLNNIQARQNEILEGQKEINKKLDTHILNHK